MRTRPLNKLWLLGCAAAWFAGCHRAPPPAAPPAPIAEAPPPPAPPPAPKCETPEEACVSHADTRARIKQSGWEFAPPEGWTYAQGEDLTRATGKNAALAVTAREKGDDKKGREAREEMLRLLTEKLGVTLPKKKSLLAKKPDQVEKVGDLSVDLYQLDGAKRDGKKGPLLIFAADSADRQLIVGAGFVADDDADNSDRAILSSIRSMSHADAKGGADAKKTP